MNIIVRVLKSKPGKLHAFLVNDKGEAVATLKKPVDTVARAEELAREYEQPKNKKQTVKGK